MSGELTAENLYNLSDEPVQKRVLEVFVNQLQSAPSVHGTFFGSVSGAPFQPTDPGWTDNVASALVCSSIGRSSLYGFAGTVDLGRSDGYWRNALADQTAVRTSQQLYDWAFPAYCQGEGHTFQQYLQNNPQNWGKQLAEKITQDAFINNFAAKVIAADPGWPQRLNLTFYKLHRLNPDLVSGVVEVWKQALPDKQIQADFATYNFIPGSLFQVDQFLAQVNNAIGQKRTSSYCGGSVVPVCAYWTYYGEQVDDFVKGKAQQLGLATGRRPQNNPDDASAGGGGCFIAGTPVLLADGSTMPIEEVREGHQVVSKDGIVSMHTDEKVIVHVEIETAMYGFNEFPPFFSSGHPFWTPDGWKAMEPQVAIDLNPTMEVGPLRIGDTVYRLKSLDPHEYEEIKIESFSHTILQPGEKIYCLHLHGHPTYHADGFLVGSNYPVLTESRLFKAFAEMTESERMLIAEHLQPIMPLLRKAIGFFIEAPLERALITSHREAKSQ